MEGCRDPCFDEITRTKGLLGNGSAPRVEGDLLRSQLFAEPYGKSTTFSAPSHWRSGVVKEFRFAGPTIRFSIAVGTCGNFFTQFRPAWTRLPMTVFRGSKPLKGSLRIFFYVFAVMVSFNSWLCSAINL